MSSKSYWQYALLLSGIVLSLLLVISLPKFYHNDLRTFLEWSHYWPENWKDIYLNCEGCNYPILGIFSSAGLLSMLGNGSDQKALFSYRLLLGLIDGINVILIFWLLRKFSIKNAALWAGIIGILPSSWAGGALWGQIDGISQFLILIAWVWIISNNKKEPLSQRNFSIYLVLCGVLLSWLILLKQLTIFSVAAIGLLLTAHIFFFSRKWSRFALYTSLMTVVLAFGIFIWDCFLTFKGNYFSHLYFIWKVRSYQGSVISGNGFNIWMLLGRNMWSSSQIPFFSKTIPNLQLMKLFSPFSAGIFLFLVFNSIAFLSLVLFLRRHYQNGERFLNSEILLSFLFFFALVNLSFNVLLTGTHERYLYPFYPFIILACLGLRKYSKLFSKNLFLVIILGSIFYGLFVLGVLAGNVFHRLSPLNTLPGSLETLYLPHWFLGIFHFGLLCSLFLIFLNYHEFNKNIRNLFRNLTIRFPSKAARMANPRFGYNQVTTGEKVDNSSDDTDPEVQ